MQRPRLSRTSKLCTVAEASKDLRYQLSLLQTGWEDVFGYANTRRPWSSGCEDHNLAILQGDRFESQRVRENGTFAHSGRHETAVKASAGGSSLGSPLARLWQQQLELANHQ
jgi:hypothetical protein